MDEEIIIGLLIGIVLAAGLAFIPANIAKKKGYSFGAWWFYGWMLWIVALIHSFCLKDKNAPVTDVHTTSVQPVNIPDELLKYKKLLDCGAITEEEFNVKKNQLIKMM